MFGLVPAVLRRRGVVSSLLTGLISYWKLDEASGSRVDSVAASANDLTPVNAPGNAAGRVGNALSLVAASVQSLSHADNASLSRVASSFSIAGWASFTSLPVGFNSFYVVAKDANSGAGTREFTFGIHFFGAADVRWQFGLYDNAAGGDILEPVLAPLTATWYFFVAWFDAVGVTMNFQINNGAVQSQATTRITADSITAFVIGAGGVGMNVDGLVDEVGFWKVVLTAAQRTNLYNAGLGVSYPFAGLP